MKENSKNYIGWIVIVLCILVFSTILKDVLTNGMWSLDTTVQHLIANNNNKAIITACKILAKIGGRGGIAVITTIASLVCIFKFKNKKMALLIVTNILGSGVLNHILKEIIQRPRPEHRMMEVSGYSFPSGHTMGAMALWGLFIVLTYKFVKNKILKTYMICIMSLIIIFMGASRVYLGVHYPSDVIAGFAISLAYLILNIKLAKFISAKTNGKEVNKDGN